MCKMEYKKPKYLFKERTSEFARGLGYMQGIKRYQEDYLAVVKYVLQCGGGGENYAIVGINSCEYKVEVSCGCKPEFKVLLDKYGCIFNKHIGYDFACSFNGECFAEGLNAYLKLLKIEEIEDDVFSAVHTETYDKLNCNSMKSLFQCLLANLTTYQVLSHFQKEIEELEGYEFTDFFFNKEVLNSGMSCGKFQLLEQLNSLLVSELNQIYNIIFK